MNRWKKSEKDTPIYLCTHSELRKEIQIIINDDIVALQLQRRISCELLNIWHDLQMLDNLDNENFVLRVGKQTLKV